MIVFDMAYYLFYHSSCPETVPHFLSLVFSVCFSWFSQANYLFAIDLPAAPVTTVNNSCFWFMVSNSFYLYQLRGKCITIKWVSFKTHYFNNYSRFAGFGNLHFIPQLTTSNVVSYFCILSLWQCN